MLPSIDAPKNQNKIKQIKLYGKTYPLYNYTIKKRKSLFSHHIIYLARKCKDKYIKSIYHGTQTCTAFTYF